MYTETTRLVLAAMLCCAGSAALAADNAAAPAAQVVETTTVISVAPGAQIIVSDQDADLPVKNAPYTANVVKERQQILGDGNQISHRIDTRAYRDSAGRTRDETLDETGAIRTVVIKDPVAATQWILNPRTKTAVRKNLPMPVGEQGRTLANGGALQIVERHMKQDGGEELMIKRTPRTSGSDGTVSPIPDQKITILSDTLNVRNLPNRASGVLPLDPTLSAIFTDIKWARQATKRTLEPREIDGVKATGQLRSYEIPAGALGNRNPIVVSDEIWTAPDLRITLSSKHSDPRTGYSDFRIENLKRDEPAAALFAPPADYTVEDMNVLIQRARNKKPE